MEHIEIKKILTKNECYKVGEKRKFNRGVIIHDTATIGAMPDAFVKSWNVSRPGNRQVCVHAFADNKKIINTLPYEMVCWGCGSGKNGSGNSGYVQIEMCVPKEVYFENGWNYRTTDKEKTVNYILEMVDIVVDWTTDRLIEMNIKEVTDKTVIGHYEAYKLGIASNHSDPKGLLSLAGLTMDDFRKKCRISLSEKLEEKEMRRYQKLEEIPNWAKATVSKLVLKGVISGTKDGLNLTDDMLRILVINDRMGLYK